MNDINRKQMKDIIVPQNDIVRRQSVVPEVYSEKAEMARIEKNPFFEKARNKPKAPIVMKKPESHSILWALLFVLLLSCVFFVANYFSTATIEVTPVSMDAVVENDFTALKDATEGELTYSFATSTEEKVKEISATVEQKIQKKAFGTVVIFNKYDSKSQRLIKNTRLEDNVTHKIFHTDQSVVVPGAKIVAGKVVEPGSVEALVYADAAGEEYNIRTSNFTIPGFKGDPRYSKFTAVSKPDSPIEGGFSGTVKVPSDADIAKAQEELKQELTKTVVEKARAQIPENMTLFPGSVVVKFEEVPQDLSNDNAAKVIVRATVTVFFFDSTLLTQKIAETVLSNDTKISFLVPDMSALKFTFIDPADHIVPSDLSTLSFHLSGVLTFMGEIDTNKILNAFVGKNKKDFGSIIVKQDNVYTGEAVIRPMWKTVFPTDPTKIKVKIVTK